MDGTRKQNCHDQRTPCSDLRFRRIFPGSSMRSGAVVTKILRSNAEPLPPCDSHLLVPPGPTALDRPASNCADRPLSGRDFASSATSTVNHSRGDLRARVSGIHSTENSQIQSLAMARRTPKGYEQSRIGGSNCCSVVSRSCFNVSLWKKKMNRTTVSRNRSLSL